MKSIFLYGSIIMCVINLTAGQLLFKSVSLKMTDFRSLYNDWQIAKFFLLALILYASSTLLWISALRFIPLTQAYMFMAIGYIILPVASSIIYGETLSLKFAVGAVMITLGVLLCVTSLKSS